MTSSRPAPGRSLGAAPSPGRAAHDPDRGGLDLLGALRAAWANAPLLLLGSVAVTAAMLLTVVVLRAGVLVAASVGLLVVPPTMIALVRTCYDVVDGRDPSIGEYGRWLSRLALRAIGIGAVPLVLAALTRLAFFAHEQGGGPLMLVPAGLGATATVLALLASLVLLPMRAVDLGVTGVRAWLYALHLFARSPVPYIAAAIVGALGVSLAVTVSNGLFLVVPAPFALLVAMAWTVGRSGVMRG